jgi:hypothetical protein
MTEGFDVNHTTDKDGCPTLGLSKIGYIPIRAHQEIPATENIKRVVLKKEGTGGWFVCLVTERLGDDLPEKSDPSAFNPADCVGVDLGIPSYIHTSDDTAVDMLNLSDECAAMHTNSGNSTGKNTTLPTERNNGRGSLQQSGKSNGKCWTTSTSIRRGRFEGTIWSPLKLVDRTLMLETSQNAAWHGFWTCWSTKPTCIALVSFKSSQQG